MHVFFCQSIQKLLFAKWIGKIAFDCTQNRIYPVILRFFFKYLHHIISVDIFIYMYSASQFKFYAYNKSLCKWGHFEKAKTTFKMLLATWFLMCFFKKFRSFNTKNLGSVGQRAAKLHAIKLGEWFDPGHSRMRAAWFAWCRGWPADFFLRPPTLTASNFEAL